MFDWGSHTLLLLSATALLSSCVAQFTVPFTQPGSCQQGNIFDTANLRCTACRQGFNAARNQRSCFECDASTGRLYDFSTSNGLSLAQEWRASDLTGANACQCSASGTLATTALIVSEGKLVQRCVECPTGTTLVGTECVASGVPGINTPQEDFNLANRLLALSLSWTQAISASFPGGQQVSPSDPLAKYLGPGAATCFYGDRTGCNAVANLCALQLYNTNSAACRMYAALLDVSVDQEDQDETVSTTVRPNTGAVPWLLYQGDAYTTAKDVGLRFAFSGGPVDFSKPAGELQTISELTLVLSKYALNGTWLGYQNWTKQFQLCGSDKGEAANWLTFGFAYNNRCSVDLTDILLDLAPDGETVLYDPFLVNGVNTLYPIPVEITNGPGPADAPATGGVRRFFYVDGSLGTTQGNGPQVVQYPTRMRLSITLMENPRNQIFPPLLTITYASRTVASATAQELEERVSFEVDYSNGDGLDDEFWEAWQNTLIVFETVVAFPMGVWKIYLYLKKPKGGNPLEQGDTGLLIYILLVIIDVGSWALCMVLFVVTLYYLILYKLQASVYFLMLDNGDLENFKITVILAIVGQTVAVLAVLFDQIRTDVVFIDWEKPRKVLTRDGSKENNAPVSAWRVLMVANQWNQLQTKRITMPGLTLLLLVMILQGQGLINAGNVNPSSGDHAFYNNAVMSIILRFGITAVFFFILVVGQYLFMRVIYHRFVSNPITNFVDLMFLANISMVVLDDRLCGYYIHGRNQAQHSDTSLRDLNNELLKEEEGLLAHRGLITSYHGDQTKHLVENQTFMLYLTYHVRRQYEQKLLQRVEAATATARNRGIVRTFVKGIPRHEDDLLQVNQEIADLFKQEISDAERNHPYKVINPPYLWRVIRMPPVVLEPGMQGSAPPGTQPFAMVPGSVFVHDYFNSFTNTMYWGYEIKLAVYEALFFCAVDMQLQNVPLTALLTFLVFLTLRWLRSRFGENNLSQKTLINKHWLL